STWLARRMDRGPRQARFTASPYRQRTRPPGSTTSRMITSVGGRSCSDEPASWGLGDEALDPLAHLRHLRGDLLAQGVVVAQLVRADAGDELPGLLNQGVQLRAAADVQLAEAAEELGQIADDRVAKDASLPVLAVRQPLSQVRQQPGELGGEGLLGQ